MNTYPSNVVAYTYLIGWSHLDRWYYGVRWARGCHPSDLWITYFTSSKHVKKFRKENGEPDVIQVRRTFISRESSQTWETTALRRMKVVKDDRWLNKAVMSHADNSGKKFGPRSDDVKEKLRNANLGKRHSEETKKKNSLALKGRKRDPEAVAKTAAALRGRKRPAEVIEKMRKAFTGRKASNETRKKMSISTKKTYEDPNMLQQLIDLGITGRKKLAGMKNRKLSDETKAKMKESQQKRARENQEKGIVRTYSDETKKKMSNSRKNYWKKKREEKINTLFD